jgi:hypothetical protein
MGWNSTGRHADRKRKRISADVTKAGLSARKRKSQPSSAHPGPEEEPERPQPASGRTGIVSVNGRDVERMHCRQS